MRAVFDTNILVDYLRGNGEAKKELNLYSEKLISVITWIEVLAGAESKEEAIKIEGFLSSFTLISVDQRIGGEALKISAKFRIKVPDAIIWGTAACENALLVTRNTKDFPKSDPSVRIPYQL